MNSSQRIDTTETVAQEIAATPAAPAPEHDWLVQPIFRGEPRYALTLPLPDGSAVGMTLPRSRPTEMVRMPALCPIPNVATWFRGMLNLRGTLVPTFDLVGSLFDDARLGATRLILVIGSGEGAFAIPIQSEPTLQHLGDVTPLPANVPGELRPYSDGAFLIGDSYWLDFQFDRWTSQLFSGAARGRSVRRAALQGT